MPRSTRNSSNKSVFQSNYPGSQTGYTVTLLHELDVDILNMYRKTKLNFLAKCSQEVEHCR